MADKIFKKSENLLQTDPASGFLLKREGELKERLSELKRIKSDKSIRKWKSESSFLNVKAGSKCHTMCASERKDDRKKKIPGKEGSSPFGRPWPKREWLTSAPEGTR